MCDYEIVISAYEDGYHAYLSNFSKEDNPFKAGTSNYDDWNNGYDTCEEE